MCTSVGPDGEILAVWTAAGDLEAVQARTTSPGGAVFPDPESSRPVTARITVHNPGPVSQTRIGSLRLAHITIQPMPGGRFLVAGARCWWRPGGPDRNAVVYDAAGQVVSEHVLGDGIAHLQATSTGQVWAGYFDEGVYGNYGWGQHDSEMPVGAPGIVQFSPALEPQWRYPPFTAGGPWEPISDCFALNVTDTCIWTCYDPGYAVIAIRDGIRAGWHSDIIGVRALATDGTRVALLGGYGPDHDRLALARLGESRAELVAEYRVVLPGGQPLPPETGVIGRRACLHVLTGTDWYQLDLGQIPG